MANKPSYKAAHKARKGSATMEIDPVTPGTSVVDKTKPEPHTESLVPPLKAGEHPPLGISPTPSGTAHAESGTVKPGEYDRPQYTDVVKT